MWIAYNVTLLGIHVFHDEWRWKNPYFYFWPLPCNYMQYLKVNNALTNFVYCVMGCAICRLFTYILDDDLSYEKWCKMKRLYLSFNRCSVPHYFVFKKVLVLRHQRRPNSCICHKYCVSLIRLLFLLKPFKLLITWVAWRTFVVRMDFMICRLVYIA
jgi:hypothetical protein